MVKCKEVTFRDIAVELSDGLHAAPKFFPEGEYIFVNAKNIVNGRIVDVDPNKKTSYEEYLKYKIDLDKNTILYSIDGTIGNVAKYRGEKVVLGKGACYIRLKPEVDSDYIFFYLQSPQFSEYIRQMSTGSTIRHISLKTMRNHKFCIPDILIQKRIACILSSLQNKIDNNNLINENLSSQIEALLLSYLDSEDVLPVKLGDYLYIKGRIGWKGLKKSEYLPQSEYRIINGETLTQSGIDWNKAGYISEERYVESPEIMLKVGDILLSKDGTIGKIGYVDSLELPTSVASGIFVIRNTKPEIISTTFIYYLLKSRLFTSFIAARTEGSVIPHLYQKDFMDFEFPLPAAEKMTKFEAVAEPMFSQILNNLNENKKLALLRGNLLPKLMSGELDVSELDI